MRRRNTTARMWPMGAVYALMTQITSFYYEVDFTVNQSLFLLFSLSFFSYFQPRDVKKEREPERGNKVSSYTKVFYTHSSFMDRVTPLHCFTTTLFFTEWRAQTSSKSQPCEDFRTLCEPTRAWWVSLHILITLRLRCSLQHQAA